MPAALRCSMPSRTLPSRAPDHRRPPSSTARATSRQHPIGPSTPNFWRIVTPTVTIRRDVEGVRPAADSYTRHMVEMTSTTALIVVDMQNDFGHPDGSLFVAGGDGILGAVNSEIERSAAAGGAVVLTQDWHPASTPHFIDDGVGKGLRPMLAREHEMPPEVREAVSRELEAMEREDYVV